MRTPASPWLTIEHALLGFIFERPVHGYDIYQQLAAPDGLWQVWRLKQSQLYALLSKLEENGYIVADLQPQEARPPRKIYSLTAAGRAAFQAWLRSPVSRGRQMRSEFLAKFYFACRQDPPAADDLLAQQIAACEQWLAELRRQTQAAPAQEMFAHAVQQFRINQVEAFLAWLAACRQALALMSKRQIR
jgi:DNA-binding PadR family transcriptional regulator